MKTLKQIMKRIATLGLTAVLLVNTVPLEAFAADPAGAGGDISIEAEVAGAGGDVSIEAEASYPAFAQSETVDGVKITIGAEEGVFPEGAVLSAEKVTKTREEETLEAVEEERPGEQNVAASYTFDIKVLDRDGNEIQPADESRVKLSFKLEEVADSNLETNIYHVRETDPDGTASGEKAGDDRNYSEETTESNDTASSSEDSDNKELIAEKLEVETEGDTATAETDGFSLYTVEFSYNDLQYVMPGDSEIALSEILNKVSLTGEVTKVEVSSPELFSAHKNDSGEWIVTAHKAFSSEEWMKVTINDKEYKITVTDDLDTMSFADLQALIDGAADGGTVKLEKDVNWKESYPGVPAGDSNPLEIPSGKTVTLDLNGHTIDRGLKNNSFADNGNVITVKGNLTLTDSSDGKTGKLTGGNTSGSGGGVCIDDNGTFTMEGGSITDCITESQGGGVNVNGTFNMTGGTISGCNATNNLGGGVCVYSGTFTMNGGTISGCTGRGVFVDSSSTFTMSGGARIDGCTSASGGGVYVNGGTFTMNGSAQITGCTATNGADNAVGGGGVRLHSGTFNVSGAPVISGNKKGDKTNNVVLNDSKTITVTGALTDGAEIRVSGANGKVIAKPGTGYTLTADDVAKLHSDDTSLDPVLENGEIKLATAWGALQARLNNAQDGGTITLTRDYVSETTDTGLVVPSGKTVTLDLNDHYILYKGTENAPVITVNGSSTLNGSLTLKDSKTTGRTTRYITLADGRATGVSDSGTLSDTCIEVTGGFIAGGNNVSQNGGGVYVKDSCMFTMEGGTIVGCKAGYGGGVNVNNRGTFTMEDGTIVGCKALYNGSGVFVSLTGNFYMNGGGITNCTAIESDDNHWGGGVFIFNSGTFIMEGGSITDCTADSGGGVYVYNGTFKVSGKPVISGNKKGDKTNNVTLNGEPITVTGALTTGAEIWVNASNDSTVAVPDNPSGSTTAYTITAADVEKFHSDDTSLSPRLDDGNVVLKVTLPTATLSNPSMVYNGSAFSPTISFVGKTLKKDSDYTLSYKKVVDTQETALAGAPKDAGSYKLVVTGKDGYTGTRELAFTITQKAVTVSGITVKDKIYDGSTTAELITTAAEFTGICEGDLLTVSANGAGTFADKNAAESKTVNIDATKFVLGGASAGNYVLAESDQQSTADAKIKRRPVTITAEDQDMAEGGSIVSDMSCVEITPGEGLTTALVSGHALSSINLTHTLDASHNNMTGTITAAQASIVGAGNTDVSGNYDITYVNGTCKVIPAAVNPDDVTLTDTTITIAANKTRDFQKYIVVRKGTRPLPDLMDSAWKAGTGSNGGGLVFTGLTRATEYDIYTCTAYGMVSAVTTVKTDKSDTVIYPVPAERTLTYNGEVYALVTESSANGGTLQYALGKDAVNVPASGWSESVPVARNAGTYYVWYKVDGGAAYKDVLPVCVTVTIAKADQTLAASVLPEETEASYAVTVNLPAGDNSSAYEYVLAEGEDSTLPADPSWKQLPAIRNGQFMPENPGQDQMSLAPATSYKIWLRLKEDSNHNASEPISKTFTTPAKVMLSYDANGGSGKLPEAKLYDADSTTDQIDEGKGISRYGYSFQVWTTVKNGTGTPYNGGADGFQINSSTVLYAQWTRNSYTVKYDANSEDASGNMSDQTYTYDNAQALTQNAFTRADYTFAGWALKPDGEVVYKNEESVKNLAPSGEVTLYAVWVENSYTIGGTVKEFNGDPASWVKVQLMRGGVQYGTDQTTDQTTDGNGAYSFTGVPAGTYNIIAEKGTTGENAYRKMTALVEVKSNRSVDDIILPAARVNSAVVVTNGTPAVMVGELDEVAKDEKEEGKEVTVTMTVQTEDESNAEGAAEIKALAETESATGADVEVDYLNIEIKKEVSDGTATTNETMIRETDHVIEMIVPFNFANRKNCELFRCHDGIAQKFNALNARPTADLQDATFYADRANSRMYVYGSRFSTYAISYETASKVMVTFRKNDGTEAQETQDVELGVETALSANSFTRSGYSFSKWNTKADGSGTDYSNGQSVTLYNDLELYAQWRQNSSGGGRTPAKTSYTVSFDLGGHGAAITPQTVEKDKTATKPEDPEAESFVFTGWYTSAACLESELFDFSTPITKDITLYAGWREAKKFTVSFNMNGKEATDVPETQLVEEGRYATEPAVSPKAEGFKFAGWYAEAECETLFDFAAPVVADTVVYAKWIDEKAESFTVSFNMSGKEATDVPETQLVEEGRYATEPAVSPKAEGFKFAGWYAEAECETLFDFAAPVVADTVVYAKWIDEKAESFTVSFDLNGKPGTAPSPQIVEKDKTVTEPGIPKAEGFTFTGWYKEKDCRTKYDFTTPVTADITLYAGWESGEPIIIETGSDWNLYEDASVHEFKIRGINVNGTVANSNTKSKAYYDANISGSTITVKVTGDRKEAASNAALEFDLGNAGVVEYVLPVSYVKPSFKLSSTTATIKSGTETVLKTTILTKNSDGFFEPYDMTDVKVSGTGLGTVTKAADGSIEIKTNAASKGKISIVKDAWDGVKPVSLAYTVKSSKKDVLSVDLQGLKTVVVNSNAKKQVFSFDVTFNGAVPAEGAVKIVDKKSTGLATIGKGGKLIVAYKDGVKNGTYTITLQAGEAKTNVKVKVSSKALDKAVTAKVQTKYDVVTRQGMVVIPVLKDVSGTIEAVSVAESGFFANLDVAGNIVIDYTGNKYNLKNLNIGTLTLSLKLNGIDEPVKLTLNNVKAKKTTPIVKAGTVTIPKDAETAEGKVIGTANIVSTYKVSSGTYKTISPVKTEIVGTPKDVTAKPNESDMTEIDIYSISKKNVSFKVKLTYAGGVTKTVTVKVNKK